VEAGAVLGDLCDTGRVHGYSAAFMKAAKRIAGVKLPREMASPEERPLADSLVILQRSFRFGPDSGIGALAGAVRDGDSGRALEILSSGEFPDVTLSRVEGAGGLRERLRSLVPDRFGPLEGSGPGGAFEVLEGNAVLCALRRGPFGSERVNSLAGEILRENGFIRGFSPWYPGRPVMVTGNDYGMKLFNGDAGVALEDVESGEVRIFFRADAGSFRKVIPARLPVHESAYALTVHKSQGSEYGRVLVILPDRYSPVLTRELLYTAVTRAKRSVEIWGTEEVLERAVSARIERMSGLRDALWG
jgi:exodeoxyribonuclease V alpha subunit